MSDFALILLECLMSKQSDLGVDAWNLFPRLLLILFLPPALLVDVNQVCVIPLA